MWPTGISMYQMCSTDLCCPATYYVTPTVCYQIATLISQPGTAAYRITSSWNSRKWRAHYLMRHGPPTHHTYGSVTDFWCNGSTKLSGILLIRQSKRYDFFSLILVIPASKRFIIFTAAIRPYLLWYQALKCTCFSVFVLFVFLLLTMSNVLY